MRVGLQVVFGKLTEVIAFAAAGARAIKVILMDVKIVTVQDRVPGPLGLDSPCSISAFLGNRVLRK